jgi:hypothetical protein
VEDFLEVLGGLAVKKLGFHFNGKIHLILRKICSENNIWFSAF